MATPTDAERARLRALGYTEAEITRIFTDSDSTGGSRRDTGVPPAQGEMTGAPGDLAAASSFPRNFIPGIAANVATMLNTAATSRARARAAFYLAFILGVIFVVAYFVF